MKINNDANGMFHASQDGSTEAANIDDSLALLWTNMKHDVSWYVPYYTPKITQKILLCEQINSKNVSALSYIQRSLPLEAVLTKGWFHEGL